PNKLLQKVAFCCIFAEEKPALGNLKAAFIALVCIFFAEEKPALMLPRGRLLRPREVTIDDRRRSSIMTPKGVKKSPGKMEA
ncbi:MAG: hypothetical protein ACOCOQ_08555, partial [Prevotella sp.]